ncbi:unnamed protein product [Musa acuminata subsp. burmannicoides]
MQQRSVPAWHTTPTLGTTILAWSFAGRVAFHLVASHATPQWRRMFRSG